jgi:hypothetical protein
MYREISDLGLFVQTSPYGLGLHSTDLALRARSAQKRPWSDISLYKPRVRLVRSYYTGQIHQFYQINCMFSRYKWKYSSRKRAHCKNHTAMSACKHGCKNDQLRDRSVFVRRRGGGGFRREVTGKHCHKFSETSATRAGSFCQRTSYTKWVVLCKMLIKNNFSPQDRVCRTGRKFDECDNTHRILRSCTSLSPLSIYYQLTYFTSMTNPKFYELWYSRQNAITAIFIFHQGPQSDSNVIYVAAIFIFTCSSFLQNSI